MAAERLWLDVPFAEKDMAKAAGARWDPAARRWYAPRPGMADLLRWAAGAEVPELLPGEDRSLGRGLFVDLVPSSCWFTNVRSCVAERDWERLRRMVHGRAGQRCEACGAGPDRAARRWLEAHERWSYDEARRVQTLRRLVCLCTDCHTVTHFGLAQVKGRAAEARAHLMRVTGMSEAGADRHIAAAFATWRERSRLTWTLDLAMLTDAGITVVPPPEAADRVAAAREALDAEEAGRETPGRAAPGGEALRRIPRQRRRTPG
ncbi:DUF5710 domain-containing protein [Streptomyces bohaiensis]|uniref:DUF5710 domain-containing protein n=1 Tax=Streptomyces bohaiensis TaxID=1431344 RepID=UPI001ADDE25D|nr:DUF5710 domain-containing protein [Streptomyces bohaiensis]